MVQHNQRLLCAKAVSSGPLMAVYHVLLALGTSYYIASIFVVTVRLAYCCAMGVLIHLYSSSL